MMKKELASRSTRTSSSSTPSTATTTTRRRSQRPQGLLQTHPNLKGIISPTTVGIAAAARYLSGSTVQGQGRADRPRHAEPDARRTSRTAPSRRSRCGTRPTSATWPPTPAARSSPGTITGKEGDKFKAGKLGEFTVGADGTVLLGDPFVFNADNIDQFNF